MPGTPAAASPFATPFVAPLILAASIADVPAQTAHGVRFGVSGWQFAPAVVNGSVKGFLAWADAVPTVGMNITLTWYQLEANGSWTTWAWKNSDVGAAADYIRTLQQNPSVFYADPVVRTLADAARGTGTAPFSVVNGLFFDDPFQPIVSSSTNPAADVEMLAALGWPAAPEISAMAVAIDADCGGQQTDKVTWLLNDLTASSEVKLFGASSRAAVCAWPCKCTLTLGQPTFGPWVFVSQIALGGGFKCIYTRHSTQTWTQAGQYFWFCGNCAASGLYETDPEGSNQTLPGEPCTPPPA